MILAGANSECQKNFQKPVNLRALHIQTIKHKLCPN